MIYFKKLALTIFIFSLVAVSFASFGEARGVPVYSPQNPQSPDIYLPIIFNPGPLPSVFGVETTYIDQNLLSKAGNIPTYWWRYNAFLWNQIEPQDVDPSHYNWGAVQENSLIAASQQGFTIVAVVKNTPFFAQAYNDPQNIPVQRHKKRFGYNQMSLPNSSTSWRCATPPRLTTSATGSSVMSRMLTWIYSGSR